MLHNREDLNKKSFKEGSRTTFQIQDSSSDVGYCPFEQAQDWKAFNRFTIAKKAEVFNSMAIVLGLEGTPKQFGSLIDLKCDEPMLKQDITDIRIVIRNSWQIRTTLGNLNALCAATKTPCALMKLNAHLARRSDGLTTSLEVPAIVMSHQSI